MTPQQTSALFNILTHFETYDEIEALKNPTTISQYGYPFTTGAPPPNGQDLKSRSSSPSGSAKSSISSKSSSPSRQPQITASYASVSESPVLQTILKRIPLTLPGVREMPAEFWSVRLQGLVTRVAEADLSESYDKGAMGTRKTLATAFSAMMETLSRGLLGGCPESSTGGRAEKYDLAKAKDLEKAIDDAAHEFVYGNLFNEIADWLAKSDDLEAHSPMIQAVVEYEIIQ